MEEIKKIFFLFITVALFSGCREKSSEILTFSIDVSTDSQVYLSEIAEKVDVVKLETTENSLVNTIRSVEILNNHYIINHGTLVELLMFDLNGQFVKRIGRIGRGPGEYLGVGAIAVDRERLLLSSRMGIMVFDGDGTFVQNVEIGIPYFMYAYNGQLYFLHIRYNKEPGKNNIFLSIYDTERWNLTDSILVKSYTATATEWWPDNRLNYLSRSEKIYVYYPDMDRRMNQRDGPDVLYMLENQNIVPYLTIQFTRKGQRNPGIFSINMTDNYAIITHVISVEEAGSQYPKSIPSQYYIDLRTMKGKNATNGFIDDFHGGDNVIITPIPNTDKFYYYKESDYSPEMRTTPNPTLYIGTFLTRNR